MGDGARVSYTDGAGRMGEGRYREGGVERGEETRVDPPEVKLTMAVAPPDSKERARFVVEKLAELGVARLVWVRTRHTVGRPPSPEKATGWAVGALEQSRGAYLMEVSAGEPGDLGRPLLVAHPGSDGGAGPVLTDHPSPTVLIGPEGGLGDEEIPDDALLFDLGRNVLRVETAAVVAAARLLPW